MIMATNDTRRSIATSALAAGGLLGGSGILGHPTVDNSAQSQAATESTTEPQKPGSRPPTARLALFSHSVDRACGGSDSRQAKQSSTSPTRQVAMPASARVGPRSATATCTTSPSLFTASIDFAAI